MQNLLKFILLTLISLTSLNAGYFDGKSIQFFRDAMTRSFAPDGSQKFDGQFLDSSHVKIGNDIYSYSQNEIIAFNTGLKSETGFYLIKVGESFKELYHYDKSYEFIHMSCQGNLCQNNDFYEKYPQAYKKVTFSIYKKYVVTKIATCQPNEHFNTETKQCQSCPEGYSWDPENNRCYKDCTDFDKNKYGWSDGSCTDCSNAKTISEIYKCFCEGNGYGLPTEITDQGALNGKKCAFTGSCLNGFKFDYIDPECLKEKEPKPDDNNTNPKDPDNPKDPKDPKNPNPDNPNPDPDPNNNDNEFCKKNPTDPKCKDDFCKKNPKDPKCKKDTNSTKPGGPGGGGGGDNDNKDKDAEFDPKDFDYNDIEKDVNGFKDTILKHYNDMNSKFDDFKRGYNQLINNIQGKGFSAIKDQSSSSSCPKAFKIDMGHNIVKTVYVDICKELSKLKSTFYYIFYLFFFCFFLFLTIKLTIPLMVNQFKYI